MLFHLKVDFCCMGGLLPTLIVKAHLVSMQPEPEIWLPGAQKFSLSQQTVLSWQAGIQERRLEDETGNMNFGIVSWSPD